MEQLFQSHQFHDANWAWLVVNLAFAAYDAYQAYSSGDSWGGVAASAALGFVGGSRIKAAKHIVYTLRDSENVVKYVGRTIAPKAREWVHRRRHPDLTWNPLHKNLSYKQARGLEHWYWSTNKKNKLHNAIRPIAKKNPNRKEYIRAAKNYLKQER